MKKTLVFILVLLLTFASVVPARADTYEDLEKEIKELQDKIAAAQSQERSLTAEISQMDRQIRLTTLQIQETQEQITRLGLEIEDLNDRIAKLETALSHLSELLLNRIVSSYKMSQVSYFSFIFSSTGLSDFLNRTKYLELVAEHDRRVMTDIQYAKVNFTEQKELREKKKLEQQELKKQLDLQNVKLNEQKKTKQALLTQTKNDEATYQKLLQQALAEKEAIDAALINSQQVGPIKAGEPIALIGNTGYPGCSTGAHLHFEIRKNNQWVNPGDYLKQKTINDNQNGGTTTIGSGSWDWPIEGEILLTQHYGTTPYSWRYAYSGGQHTGLDLYSNSSLVIRAPKDGVLYTSSQNCGGSSIIKIKYIEHGDGVISFYLHVQ